MATSIAINKAFDQGLDLLCVAPNANPAVCRIIDYGKFRFDNQKKAKEAKKNQQVTELKSIRLSPVIDKNDFDIKVRKCHQWLSDGLKVKVDMRFRGRLITKPEVGKKIMNQLLSELQEVGNVEKIPAFEGNTMSIVISPKKK